MGMKGKESICQIKGAVGLDNKALEVNMRAILRARQHVSVTVLVRALPPVEGGIMGNVSRIRAGSHRNVAHQSTASPQGPNNPAQLTYLKSLTSNKCL